MDVNHVTVSNLELSSSVICRMRHNINIILSIIQYNTIQCKLCILYYRKIRLREIR